MDTKRFLTSMLFAAALMLMITFFFRGGGGGSAVTALPMYSRIDAPVAREQGAVEATIQLGDPGAPDRPSADKFAVTINPATAGIDRVQLNIKDYAQDVKKSAPLTLLEVLPGLPKPFSTLGVHITPGSAAKELPYGLVREMGGAGWRSASIDDPAETIARANATCILDTQYVWKTEDVGPDKAVLSMTFTNVGVPVARVRKTFEIRPDSYELIITHSVENLTNGPLKVQIDQLGAADLYRDDPQHDERFYYAASLSTPKNVVSDEYFAVRHGELSKLTEGTRRIGQFHDFKSSPSLWAVSSNRFFAAIIRPLPRDASTPLFTLYGGQKIPEVDHVSEMHVDIMHASTKPADTRAVLRIVGAPISIPASTTVSYPLSVYLGPKDRDLLVGDLSAATGTTAHEYALFQYIRVVKFSQNLCMCYSILVLDGIINSILWLLHLFGGTVAFGNFGIAIMILVLVVRAALHPLTRASQVNMAKMGKKMRDIQPLIEASKKKYANNKQKQNEDMMRIYRENKVNPAGGVMGCLPMLIQMPIWAALYTGLQTDISLRHKPFISGWINDLSNPDAVLPLVHRTLGDPIFTIPLLGWEIYGLNLLPLLLIAVFFFQMKVMSASQPKPADAQQAQMQKMSQYMIFVFPLFLYNAPSGLNLYIFASTLGGLVDTWLVRKTLKKQGILPLTAETLPTHEQKV